jgi:hypothetical protein
MIREALAILALLLLASCFGDESASSDQSPSPTSPPWLTLRAGNKVMLTGTGPNPSAWPTTTVCDDEYEWDHYSTGSGGEQGCRDRMIGQTVQIKRVDSGDSALYIRGRGWSGVVSNEDVEPIIPAGTKMDCQSTDSLSLFEGPSDRSDAYDLRDQKETLETTHDRRSSETWAVNVKVIKGRGVGRIGYFPSEDLAACVLPGDIQVVMQDSE